MSSKRLFVISGVLFFFATSFLVSPVNAEGNSSELLQQINLLTTQLNILEQKLSAFLAIRPKKSPSCQTQIITIPAKISSGQLPISSTISSRQKAVVIKMLLNIKSDTSIGINNLARAVTIKAVDPYAAARISKVYFVDATDKLLGTDGAQNVKGIIGATPTTIRYSDFNITPTLLQTVAALYIEVANPSNGVSTPTINSVNVTFQKDVGTNCVLINEDVLTVKEKPPTTLVKKQTRVIVVYGPASSGGATTSTGPNSPSTAVNDTGTGSVAWTPPGALGSYVSTSDNSYANGFLTTGTTSNYVKVTNFGFSVSGNVVGILVEVEKRAYLSSTGNRDESVKIVKGGTITGTNLADTVNDWPASDAYISYGGSTNLWGTSWVASDINDSTFGVAISLTNPSAPGASIGGQVDHVRITIYTN